MTDAVFFPLSYLREDLVSGPSISMQDQVLEQEHPASPLLIDSPPKLLHMELTLQLQLHLYILQLKDTNHGLVKLQG